MATERSLSMTRVRMEAGGASGATFGVGRRMGVEDLSVCDLLGHACSLCPSWFVRQLSSVPVQLEGRAVVCPSSIQQPPIAFHVTQFQVKTLVTVPRGMAGDAGLLYFPDCRLLLASSSLTSPSH